MNVILGDSTTGGNRVSSFYRHLEEIIQGIQGKELNVYIAEQVLRPAPPFFPNMSYRTERSDDPISKVHTYYLDAGSGPA